MTGATARERFREAGRRVLRQPGESSAHAERVRAAIDMDGSEPVQGALADMLSACRQDVAGLLAEPAIGARLGPYVLEQLQAACSDTRPMGPVSTLATRWSVLVSPSMDMPRRALLSGVDDARAARPCCGSSKSALRPRSTISMSRHCMRSMIPIAAASCGPRPASNSRFMPSPLVRSRPSPCPSRCPADVRPSSARAARA